MENHSNINNQFIPYNLALELRNLGFDDYVFAFYWTDTKQLILDSPNYLGKHNGVHLQAPLWQQAFDWFRDKYNLVSEIFHNPEYEWKNWKYRFYWTTERLRLSNISDGHYETYEEARLECLKKLIKIVELEK